MCCTLGKINRHRREGNGTACMHLQLTLNITTWKRFLYYWPFARGIHRWPVDSPRKGPVMQSFDAFFEVAWTSKLLNKQPICQWFATFGWRDYSMLQPQAETRVSFRYITHINIPNRFGFSKLAIVHISTDNDIKIPKSTLHRIPVGNSLCKTAQLI